MRHRTRTVGFPHLASARTSACAATLALVVLTSSAATGTTAASTAQAGELRLLDRTAWVGDGVDFEVTVQATAAPPGSQLRLSVHDEVRSRSEFERSIAGGTLRNELFPLPDVPVDQVDGDGDGAVTLVVPLVARPGVDPLTLDDPGTYPVRVELLDGDDEPVASLTTHLVRLPPGGSESDTVPLSVVVVVPVHAGPADLDARAAGPTEAPVQDQLEALRTALAAHPAVAVTLAVTPESMAAAAAVELDAVDELATLAAASGSEVLDATWVRLDDAAWAATDDGALSRQLARGRQQLAAAVGEPGTTRLVPAGRGAATAAAMVDHGARLLVVDEADLEPLDTDDFPYTVARPFALAVTDAATDGNTGTNAATVLALGADETLAAHADGADTDPVLAASHLLADLAVIGADEPESARVATVVLPARAAGSTAFLDALLGGLEPPPVPFAPNPPADPVLVAATAAEAAALVEPTADGGDAVVRRFAGPEQPDNVAAVARRLAAEEADVASYRTIFGADDPIAERSEVVLASAASADIDADERGRAVASARSARSEILQGISGPEQQRVRLTDREGQIQLVLTNASGAPAAVDLLLRGDRLVFPDAPDGVLSVRLDERQTRVDLRVEARSSGDAPLDIRLASPDRRLDLGSSRITVRATAISGVGIGLMVAAAAFLAIWWTRTIIRERRGRHTTRHAHLRRTGPGV